MPSSMCWPLGEKVQSKVEGMRSCRNRSAIASRANSPRRFTQPPRLVETVTSGEVVTMRSASGPPMRAISAISRPKPCWVESSPCFSAGSSAGTSMLGAS